MKRRLDSLDRIQILMNVKIQLLSKKLKRMGFEDFKQLYLHNIEYVVDKSLEFGETLSEENGQLLSELAFKMDEQRVKLKNGEFVNATGAFKIATVANCLVSGRFKIAKVIPNRGGEFRFQTCFRFNDASRVADHEILKKELVTDELKLADPRAFIVLFIAGRAWILESKREDLLPPFEFP